MFRFEARLLGKIADMHPFIHPHLAFRRLELLQDQGKKRTLAGAVGADKPDLLPLVDIKGDILKENLWAVVFGKLDNIDHIFVRSFGCALG